MKKYIIKSIGWVFDDDWYNFDGEHDVVGVYNTYKEATAKCKQLNHQSLLQHFPYLHNYQRDMDYLWKDSNTQQPDFVDVEKIAIFLAKELNLNKNQLLRKEWRGLLDDGQILKRITVDLADGALKIADFHFFKIIELEAEAPYLYHIKKNPSIWSELFQDDIDDPDYFFYIHDDRYSEQKRLVNNIKECYEYALRPSYDSIRHALTSHTLLKGGLSELSRTPNLLGGVIEQLEHIEYDSGNKAVIFKEGFTAEELMALDSVLTEPVIIPEKVPVEDLV